jgi:hypothetical protein
LERIRDKPYSEDALREYLLDGLSGTNTSEEFMDIWDVIWVANHREPIDCTVWLALNYELSIGQPLVYTIGRCDYREDDGERYTVFFDLPLTHRYDKYKFPWRKFFKRNK